jgi:hypothetical protein
MKDRPCSWQDAERLHQSDDGDVGAACRKLEPGLAQRRATETEPLQIRQAPLEDRIQPSPVLVSGDLTRHYQQLLSGHS